MFIMERLRRAHAPYLCVCLHLYQRICLKILGRVEVGPSTAWP